MLVGSSAPATSTKDGSGYPDGLAGDAIPQVARIVCCCDAFTAMTTDRPYRSAMSLSAAISELKSCAGTQFDPAVVAALIDMLAASQPRLYALAST